MEKIVKGGHPPRRKVQRFLFRIKLFREKLRNTFLYAGARKKSYEGVKDKIIAADRATVQKFSALSVVLITGMFIFTLFVGGVSMNRTVYGVGAIVALALFITSMVTKDSTRLVLPMVYVSYSIFYVYGIMIGAVTDPSQKAVTFMVTLVLLPVIFIGRPIYSAGVTTFYILVFIALCLKNKSGDILGNDVVDAIIFGLLGIISGTMIACVKVRGFILEEELKISNSKLAADTRIDVMTGLNNRNAYERDLYKASKQCVKCLGCVYIDVNGLKHINDTYGHEQGDLMLITVAEQIKACYGEEFAYRVGGDEFVIFVPDPGDWELKGKADKLSNRVEAMNYHVAIGWKIHDLDVLSVKDLIKEAEKRMSDKKTEFYEQADFDRRKH